MYTYAVEKSNTAKTQLFQLYKSNPEQTTFYCNCEFAFKSKKGIVDFQTHKFQPKEQIRGTIARTYIYMFDKYKINLSESERDVIRIWDIMYKPSVWECKRNELITEIQGNDNKFVT